MIPPDASAEFVCQLEEILDVYHRPPDPQRPLVCLDEASKQLVEHVQVPIEATPGRPRILRLRIRAQRNRQRFHVVRVAGRSSRCALITERRTTVVCSEGDPASGRCGASGRGADPAGAGQPQQPQIGVAVRGVPARRSAAADRPPGDSLHAEARQLAQHGGTRTESPRPPVT